LAHQWCEVDGPRGEGLNTKVFDFGAWSWLEVIGKRSNKYDSQDIIIRLMGGRSRKGSEKFQGLRRNADAELLVEFARDSPESGFLGFKPATG
jgi:hypothetical protein